MSDDQGSRRPGGSKPTRKKRTSGRAPKKEARTPAPAPREEEADLDLEDAKFNRAPAGQAQAPTLQEVRGQFSGPGEDRGNRSDDRDLGRDRDREYRDERDEREMRDADRGLREERVPRRHDRHQGRNDRGQHRGQNRGHDRGPRRDDRPPQRDQRDQRDQHREAREQNERPPQREQNQAPREPMVDEEFENRGNQGTNPNRPQNNPAKQVEGTEFSIQVMFDRPSRQYTASVLEFPDVKVTGSNRETVIRELEVKVEDKLLSLRETSQPIPDPLGAKRYPDTLNLRLSQALFRKLDLLSRQERTELSELVNELLNGAVERRYEQLGSGRSQPQQQHGGGRQQHHHDRDNRGNREQGGGKGHGGQHGNRGGGRGGRMSQSNYQNTMSSRENFMEYVRNLEKGGPGWKKR